MAEVTTVQYEESTVSSVRSTISTASSGYAIISVPGKQRHVKEDVRAVYPAEPPPDYDDPPGQNQGGVLPRYIPINHSSPKRDNETTVPLLSGDSNHNDCPRTAPDIHPSPTGKHESRIPLIIETDNPDQLQKQQQQTIVRISSRSQDLNIEILSSPSISPTQTDSTFAYTSSIRSDPTKSPASTAADTSFLYGTQKQKQSKRKCRKLTKREKIIMGVSAFVLLVLLILLINFTVCIGEFTSKCD